MALRSETIQIGFEVDNNPLQSLIKELDSLKKKLTGVSGEDSLGQLKKQANDSVTPMQKVNKTVDQLKQKLNEVGKKAAVTAFNGIKKVASISFKSLTVGLTAAAAAAGAVVKSAVSAYADYEQLVGGVDTIFKDSSQTIQKYADNAYKTAGLSANAYMETVTSFSASLIQSLDGDTAKAAELSDKAIRDMSDNANKMGTNMGSLQYAYQGFAKQNYMMLDNLKLGYGKQIAVVKVG